MEVVVQGTEQIQADLVFVHGLRGDRTKTWEADKVFWPRDLLPLDLPNVRIMSYGYDANVMNFFSNVGNSSIFQHAVNLIEDLQRKRRTAEEKERPIIFIGHSLGGLVIKDALCKSHEYKSSGRNPRAAAVIGSTYGIVFLGTPHRGGNHTAWAKIATNFATAVLKDHNAKVIDAITRGSEILERLQDSFCGIVGQISIFSFFEDLATGSAGKIVDDDSATLGLSCERKQWIPANHSEMCKFKSSTDCGYERVSGGIIDLVEDAVVAVDRKDAARDNWVNVDQHGQPVDMSSDLMKAAYGPLNKALRNPDELFEKSQWGIDAVARHQAMNLSGKERNEIIAYLFLRKFYPLTQAKANDALFTSCLRNGNTNVAQYLLRLGADDATERHGYPVLHMAIHSDCEPGVEALLSCGANPNVKVKKNTGATPLMVAADKGSENYVSMLINAKGVNLDLQDNRGSTALMHAAAEGNYEIVNMLMVAGADETLRDDQNQIAADIAKRLGPRRGDKIVQLLESHSRAAPGRPGPGTANRPDLPGGAQSGTVSELPFRSFKGPPASTGLTPLPKWGEFATARHRLNTLSLSQKAVVEKSLASNGFNPLTRENVNKALVWACSWKRPLEAQFLLSLGADTEVKDGPGGSTGDPVLFVAIRTNLESTVKHLISCGVYLDSRAFSGITPLMFAASSGLKEIVNILLCAGADSTLRWDNGWTALTFAKRGGHDDIVNMLGSQGVGRN